MKYKFLLLALFSTLTVTACGHFSNDLSSRTYNATDRMMAQSKGTLKNTPMLVGTINDIDYLETSSTLGRVVQEQIASRLTQKGYNVTELKLRSDLNIKQGLVDNLESGEYMLSRDLSALKNEHKAAAVVTGTYAVAGQDILVNLKLLDVQSGKVLGAIDYSIDLDVNMRRLTRTTPSAMGFYGESQAYN